MNLEPTDADSRLIGGYLVSLRKNPIWLHPHLQETGDHQREHLETRVNRTIDLEDSETRLEPLPAVET